MKCLFILLLCFSISWSTIGGPAGGDLQGTYPNPELILYGVGPLGPIGDNSIIAVITSDNTGRVTNVTSATLSGVSPSGPVAGTVFTGTFPNPTFIPITSVNSYYNPIITPLADGRVGSITSKQESNYQAVVFTSNYLTTGDGLIHFDSVLLAQGWGPGTPPISTFFPTNDGVFYVTCYAEVVGAGTYTMCINLNGVPYQCQTYTIVSSTQTFSISTVMSLIVTDTLSVGFGATGVTVIGLIYGTRLGISSVTNQ